MESAAARRLLAPALVGAAVAVALGAYGRVHTATGGAIPHPFFSGVLNLKAWLATVVLALGCCQVVTALAMWGRVPLRGSWVAPVHRATGTLAFLVSLPVAYQCLWALGFRTTGTRQVLHSVLGCAFYGVFTTKMLALRSKHLPGWALPVLGGTLFSVLVALWWSSALWFFRTVGFPAF